MYNITLKAVKIIYQHNFLNGKYRSTMIIPIYKSNCQYTQEELNQLSLCC